MARTCSSRAAAVLLALSFATLARGQEWRGEGRLRGRVLDVDGHPAAGAVIRAYPTDEPDGGPPPTTTNAAGRWSLNGLAAGYWTIRIDYTGHIVAHGRVRVADAKEGPSERVDVRLRSLEEVSPQWTEGSPDTVLEWIDKGDSFLRDGRAAEARAEYERALDALPWRERVALLQAVARTFYLEGNREKALETLQSALMIDPADESSRRLTAGVYAALGRAGEADAFFATLPSEPTEPSSPPRPSHAEEPTEPPPWSSRPILEPEAHRRGRYRMRLEQRSPLGSLEEYARRYGVSVDEIRASDPQAGSYRIADELFEAYVPEDYDPATAYGLFVWVSPSPFGGTERPEIQRLLSERHLLWIGADGSGNARRRWDRTSLALDGAAAMVELYHVDPSRIVVGGYSGGARIAGGLALLYPELFRGALYVKGGDFYRDLPVPDRPGASWPAAYREPGGKALRDLQRDLRIVIVTGSRDFNHSLCREIHQAFLDDGFRTVPLLDVPGMSHYDAVPTETWGRALDFLDGR